MIRHLLLVCTAFAAFALNAEDRVLQVLFLGDNGHHQPVMRFAQIEPVMSARGIKLTYSEKMEDVIAENLAKYDGLLIYANTVKIEPAQEQALLDYVASGKGFIPIHCASYCFLNSEKYIALVGAQFKSHTTGTFNTKTVSADHPIMKGFEPFETWDETYVHTKHNDNRTVLQTRPEGGADEPWTWVRTHGKGRIFYTAYGHDGRTWGNPGFQNLLERGVRWACGETNVVDHGAKKRTDLKPFEYQEANVPFYAPPAGARSARGRDNWNKMQLPLPPEESMKHIVVPQDFEVKLFASEPDIVKPICMAWDHKGRLWVCESLDYPNNKQTTGGADRIKICEDTNGDGRADKFTIFADQLSIPTSLCFANGGVIVHQAPETLFLKDTNGDDKADERKVLFTGWGVGDTHAGPSNLRYGHDNWIYGIVGYSAFRGEVGGEKHDFRQGFYRFKPDGSKLEFLRATSNNSWGVGFSEDGLLFGSTANGNPSMYLPIPNRYYESVRGWSAPVLGTIAESNAFHAVTDRVRQVDWHGGFTAAAGHALYTARAFPKEYWNRTAFVCEPTGHLVATFILERKGSDFASRNSWNIFASDDEWTAPIMAEVGPDGALWVVDWYNYIVQHNPTPVGFKNGKGNAYEIPLRDKTHGRVYRVVYSKSKPYTPVKLDPNDPATLVEGLKSDNMLWRLHAQRLLVERGKSDVFSSLSKLVDDKSIDETEFNGGAIHALLAIEAINARFPLGDQAHADQFKQVHAAALQHPAPAVRTVGAAYINENSEFDFANGATLQDKSRMVRLASVLALAKRKTGTIPSHAVARALFDEQNLKDKWLPDALTCAAAADAASFLGVLVEFKKDETFDPKAVAIVGRVAEHYARGTPLESVGAMIIALQRSPAPIADAILAGLEKGWPKDAKIKLDENAEKALVELMTKLPASGKSRLVTLANRWGSNAIEKYAGEIAGALLAKVRDDKEPENERLAAVAQLMDFRKADAETARELLKLITPKASTEFASGVIDAVARSEAAETGAALAAVTPTLTPSVKPRALAALLSKAEWTQAFMDSVEKGKLQIADLSLDQKTALAAHPNKTIAESAKKLIARGGGLPDPDRQKVIEELSPTVLKKGNAVNGKLVFQNTCSKCHMHSGVGNRIGPDLTGMAAHPKEEMMIAILDPSRSVEGNYRLYQVVLDDGRVLVGLLTSETKTSIEITDAEAKVHPIQRENIKKLVATPQSLMPEGFEKQVTVEQITDLLEFLTQRGKFMPLDLGKVATVVSTKDMFFDRGGDPERLVFPDWTPKTFEGVTFTLVDPQGTKVPNAIMLHGPNGVIPPKMPKSVSLPCNAPAKAIHFLSGVSGWGSTTPKTNGTTSMVVRLKYADGKSEDHALKDGEHFADYIRVCDVPKSKLAFKLRNQQIRYFALNPKRTEKIETIELLKGPDNTAPVVMAITVEGTE